MNIPTCSRDEWLRNVSLTNEEASKIILPGGWHEIPIPPDRPLHGIRAYKRSGLSVLFSVDGDIEGKVWLHVSLARKNRIPAYEEMVEVKKVFIGEDRQAIQVLPRKEKHINIDPNCLHLWCCLEPMGDGLPDFGKHGII